MTGWISLHRQIRNHWIWDDADKLKWWLDILLLTNHTDKKSVYNNEVILIKRGTFKTSEVKLSERWGVSRNTVRKFLKLLESDEMITTNKTPYGTTVEVLNYNDYQGFSMKKEQPSEQPFEQPFEQPTEQHEDSALNSGMNSTVNTTNNYNNSNNELIMTNNDNNNQSVVGVIFDKYTELGFGAINAFKAEQITEHLNTFEPEVIIKSLEVASNNNKATMNYVNGILNNWKQRGLTTLEKVEAEEKKKQLEQMKPTYQQRRREMPGEKAPDWIDKAREKPEEKSSEPVKTAVDDPELQKMIADFRNANN